MKIVIGTFLLFFLVSTLTFSQTVATPRPFTLTGKIVGENSGHIILSYWSFKKLIQDTLAINNGKFVAKGNISEPTTVQLIGNIKNGDIDDPNYAVFFIEPTLMEITLVKDKFKEFKLTGSIAQNEQNTLNKMIDPIDKSLIILKNQLSTIQDSIDKIKDETVLKNLNVRYKEIINQLDQKCYQLTAEQERFIQLYPKSFVSGDLLLNFERSDELSIDSIKAIYNKLDTTIQNSENGTGIKKDIAKKEKSIVGAIAPDFKAIDLNNDSVILSKFIGTNVVILDFWASWCSSCRKFSPFLKNMFQKYHSKGLEIISISVDNNKKAWIEAVEHDSVGIWHQIHSSDKFVPGPPIKNEIKEKYCVQGIPVMILIGKDGKIVERLMSYSEEHENLIEKKISQILIHD